MRGALLAFLLFLLDLRADEIAAAPQPAPPAEPLLIRVGHLTVKPSGFFEPIAMARSAQTNDTVSTRFGSIPLGDSDGETIFSPAHSRFQIRGDLTLGSAILTGYLENDFLNTPGHGPIRMRQGFLQLEAGKWRFLAGKGWSLLRPNRHGIVSERDIMSTHVVDPGYHIGLVGFRRPQLRVSRVLGNWQAAVEYETRGGWLTKIARDGSWGHAEVATLGGRGRRGLSIAGVVRARSGLNIVSQQFWSRGGGPDALNAAPSGVHAYTTIQGIEAQVTKKLELHSYGGIVYGARSAGNRTVRQWSAGFIHKVYSDPFYGTLSFSAQFSQLDRSLWAGGQGEMTFLMLSARYYFPELRN